MLHVCGTWQKYMNKELAILAIHCSYNYCALSIAIILIIAINNVLLLVNVYSRSN